ATLAALIHMEAGKAEPGVESLASLITRRRAAAAGHRRPGTLPPLLMQESYSISTMRVLPSPVAGAILLASWLHLAPGSAGEAAKVLPPRSDEATTKAASSPILLLVSMISLRLMARRPKRPIVSRGREIKWSAPTPNVRSNGRPNKQRNVQ